MSEEVECRRRRICGAVPNPYSSNDEYMQLQSKCEKVGIKEGIGIGIGIGGCRVHHIQLNSQNPSPATADALLLQSDFFKV